MFDKGDRVRVSREAESYKPGDDVGTVTRLRADGGVNVTLDKSGIIVTCAVTDLAPLEEGEEVWARLQKVTDENILGRWPGNPMEAGAIASYNWDREDGDPEWDDLEAEDQQDYRGCFIAGLDVFVGVLAALCADSKEDIARVRMASRKMAEFTMTGDVEGDLDPLSLYRHTGGGR